MSGGECKPGAKRKRDAQPEETAQPPRI